MTEFQKALDELIHNYDIRNTIEIEKKYHFSDEAVFQDVIEFYWFKNTTTILALKNDINFKTVL